MKKSNFALRLQPSLMEEAKKVAKAEGVSVNQLINVAVALERWRGVAALRGRTVSRILRSANLRHIPRRYGTVPDGLQ